MISDRTLTIIKIVAMIGLMITIAVVGFVVWYYGSTLQSDPYAVCSQIPIRLENLSI
jgi:hypothetical protein